jgi:hypothetical protein
MVFEEQFNHSLSFSHCRKEAAFGAYLISINRFL